LKAANALTKLHAAYGEATANAAILSQQLRQIEELRQKQLARIVELRQTSARPKAKEAKTP
jgi:hypothetical protein